MERPTLGLEFSPPALIQVGRLRSPPLIDDQVRLFSFFSKELPQQECERLMTLSEEELEGEGWTIESATRFSGPLVVEEVAVPPAA